MPEMGAEPPFGIPSQLAVRVRDCPGCKVSSTIYIGLPPALDLQTTAPPSVTMKPSMLGPSSTVTGRLETFVSRKVISTGCPGW